MDSLAIDADEVHDRLSMVEQRLSMLQDRVQALELSGSSFIGGVLDVLGDSSSALPSSWEQQMDRLCEETCQTLLVDSSEAEERLVYSKQDIMDVRRAMRPFAPLCIYKALVEEPLNSPEELSVLLKDPVTQRRSKEQCGRVSDHFPRTKQQPSPRNRSHHESKAGRHGAVSSDELKSPPKKTPSKKSPKSVRDVAMCHGLLIEPPDSD